MEIERKWHMEVEPQLPPLTHTRVSQSYLSLTPEVRVRKYEDLMGGEWPHYDLTVKSEGTMVREEVVLKLAAEQYEILLTMIGNCPPIVKDHRTYDYQGHELEFSVVDGDRETAFTYGEIEFFSMEAAQAFQAPDWFGEETTEQQEFRMKEYWRKTRLEQE